MANVGDYSSEFEYDSEIEQQRAKRGDLARRDAPKKFKLPKKTEVSDEYNLDERRKDRYHILSMDAFDRHKKFINDYLLYYGGSMQTFKRDTSRDRTDHDVIKEHHQFLWSDEDGQTESYESKLAKKYYDKLFKEYCIADLSLFKENKVALRWRIETEVFSGKGQFLCGEKKCKEAEDLRSWEVNFGYVEHGQKKNALVKVRLCPDCSRKLNHHSKKREIRLKRKLSNLDEALGDVATPSKYPRLSKDETNVDVKTETVAQYTTKSEVATPDDGKKEDDIWAKAPPAVDDVAGQNEFDDYFTDMFL